MTERMKFTTMQRSLRCNRRTHEGYGHPRRIQVGGDTMGKHTAKRIVNNAWGHKAYARGNKERTHRVTEKLKCTDEKSHSECTGWKKGNHREPMERHTRLRAEKFYVNELWGVCHFFSSGRGRAPARSHFARGDATPSREGVSSFWEGIFRSLVSSPTRLAIRKMTDYSETNIHALDFLLWGVLEGMKDNNREQEHTNKRKHNTDIR